MHCYRHMKLLPALLSAMMISVLVQLLPSVAWADEYAPAQSLGKPDGKIMGCPSGSFWDPINGGECWSCEVGKRSVFPVNGNKACTIEGFTDFAPATRLEANKTSCPSGSFFDVGKGSCWTCPSGARRTVFAVDGDKACERIIKKKKRKAKYVYKVDSLLKSCRKGTFANAGSRSCYTCPAGWKHDRSKRTGTNGVCYKPRKVTRSSATKVHDIALSCPSGFFDPIDGGSCWTCPSGYTRQVSSVKDAKACMKVQKPKFASATFIRKHNPSAGKVIKGVSQLGCANKGTDAFFDPINGGSCWTCPNGNPVRTLYPVNGNKACATKACGSEGSRPCLVWERIPSCDKGLVEDFSTNQCRVSTQRACRTYVNTVVAISNVIDKANATGEDVLEAIEQVPGAKFMLRSLSGQAQNMQKIAIKAAEKLPMDQAMAPMNRFLANNKEEVELLTSVYRHTQRVKQEVQGILLDPNMVCTGNMDRLNAKLSQLGFDEIAKPKRRTGINMAFHNQGTFRAMPVGARYDAQSYAQQMAVSNKQGLLQNHRITFDYSLTLPLEKLYGDDAVVSAPLSLGLQLATDFNGSTALYFSHGLGLGKADTTPDDWSTPNIVAKFFGATDLSVGFSFGGPKGTCENNNGRYEWGIAGWLTDWFSTGVNPSVRHLWSGFALTLPKPVYAYSDDEVLSAFIDDTRDSLKPKIQGVMPSLVTGGLRYDATWEIGSSGDSCGGPIN